MKSTIRGVIIALFFLSFQVQAQTTIKDIPVDSSYNPVHEWNKIKKAYPDVTIARDELPKGIAEKRNVVYTTLKATPYGDRDLHLDIFYPKSKGLHPVLIMIHGGGWRSGNKTMQVPLAQKLAEKGFVTICVEYQLLLEAKYPAAIHNIKSAIRWARANADSYGIDSDKIAISGSSAGGQLATLTGMTNGVPEMEGAQGNENFSSDIQAVIDIDGVLNFMAPNSLNLKRSANSPDIQWLGGSFEEKPLIWKEASPIYWVNENSVPVLFINSGFPRFHAGQDEMISMMKRFDIYTDVKAFDINVHPFWLFEPWISQTADYMDTFLNKVFRD